MDDPRSEKQSICERFVLGGISRDEYTAQKSALSVALDRMGHVLTAIYVCNKKSAPDTALWEMAKVAPEAQSG